MIVLVALGTVPPYARTALQQARRANPDEPLVLLHDGRLDSWRPFAQRQQIDLRNAASLRSDRRWREFDARPDPRVEFRGGFWRHASSRFFALRAFLEAEGIDQATHIENDVLLYARLDGMRHADPWSRPALATVFESPNRAIPGIVHVGARSSLDRFTDFVLAEPAGGVTDDMTRLAAFRRAQPALVADLPTRPVRAPNPSDRTDSFFDRRVSIPLGDDAWLFDGARFGQYLGGIDPRNSDVRIRRWLHWQTGHLRRPNGFINESCTDDPSAYEYDVAYRAGLATPVVVAGARVFPLATLHVHSKKLWRFTSEALACLVPERRGQEGLGP